MHVHGEASLTPPTHREYSPIPGEDNRGKAPGRIRGTMVKFRDFGISVQLYCRSGVG